MIRAQWQRARDEWRANRRLRLAGMAALAFLGIHLLLAMGDRREVLAARYGRDVELQARFAGMQAQKDWPERAAQAEAGLAEMRARVPAVTSAGLAQAEMQAWLTELAGRTGLAEPKVKVEDTLDVPGYPDMWQVMARLDGLLPQYGQAAFLRELSEALPWIQAERLEIAEADQARMMLVVRGYYRRAGDEEPAAVAGDSPDTQGGPEAAVVPAPTQEAITSTPGPTGPAPSVSTPSVSTPSGATPSRSTPSGQTPSGPMPSGPMPSGPMPSGPMPSGPMPSGPMPSGPMPSGPMPSGPMPSGSSTPAQSPSQRRGGSS